MSKKAAFPCDIHGSSRSAAPVRHGSLAPFWASACSPRLAGHPRAEYKPGSWGLCGCHRGTVLDPRRRRSGRKRATRKMSFRDRPSTGWGRSAANLLASKSKLRPESHPRGNSLCPSEGRGGGRGGQYGDQSSPRGEASERVRAARARWGARAVGASTNRKIFESHFRALKRE